jgi:Fe-S oxidoreductase
VQLLNKLGVKPIVSPEERCCGHDLLWNGDRKSFEALAKHNVKLVEESGAKMLVTSCAECLRTWKIDYEPYFSGKPPQILHISEYLGENLPSLRFRENGAEAENGTRKITYQDPCRMGRHLGVYEAPRKMLGSLPETEVVEMRRSGKGALCCAGGTWSSCDRYSKQIQVERLREAKETGADVLATACPKCQIHFKCAMKDPNLGGEIGIEMKDIAELVAEALDEGARPQDAK